MLADDTEEELLNSYFAFDSPLEEYSKLERGIRNMLKGNETSHCKDLHRLHDRGEIWAILDD